MFDNIFEKNESKTLEFKESVTSTLNIIKTVIAFANTAGGIIVIGIEDKTKKIIGIENILQEEERLASIIADSIEPQLLPDIDIINWNKKELILINVHYLVGPFYLKKEGLTKGTYIRLGSTNRLADTENIANLQRLSKQISFDEMPSLNATMDDLDEALVFKKLHSFYDRLDKKYYVSLGFATMHHGKMLPTHGGILLFSLNKSLLYPDSAIQCACFSGVDREHIIDRKEITTNLIDAVDEVVAFINRHVSVAAKIGTITREDIPQFPDVAIRETVINAIVHSDYSMIGSSVQIAVFSDRIEITNPGGLPFGQTIEAAISGVSRLRNRMIGRVFRELKLIERLGSGIMRIIASYKEASLKNQPKFEEINNHFRVTLSGRTDPVYSQKLWQKQLLQKLSGDKALSTHNIAKLWKVTDRTARTRLKLMVDQGIIYREGKSPNDPTATYSKC